jgi:hypothetical protein
MLTRRQLIGLAVTSLASASAAFATLPAPDEDILSDSTQVVIGTALRATRFKDPQLYEFRKNVTWDCTHLANCCLHDPRAINLVIKVDNVLAMATFQTIRATSLGRPTDQGIGR